MGSTSRGIRRVLLATLALAAGAAVCADLAHWRASRRGLPRRGPSGGREAIVVLGYRDRGIRANHLNRYRVRAGLRSRDPSAEETTLVLCGGPVASPIPEAELMARYAYEERGYRGPMKLERTSTTTRENIRNALPLIEHADTIKIVSNSLHAERGRAHLRALRPDLALRLVRADEHRFGEILPVKALAMLMDPGALPRRRR